MNNSLSTSLASYRSLEIDAHVSMEDVLSKITQEMGELMEAIEGHDDENIKKEAKDLLVNILSATSRMGEWIFPKSENTKYAPLEQIPIEIAKLHRVIAAIRLRYSRELHPPMEDIHAFFQPLIHTLLKLSGEEKFEDVVQQSILKLSSRVNDYIPMVDLKEEIAEYPDFPKPGILFRDISPILRSDFLMRYAAFEMAKHAKDADIIAGLDARGFIFATRVAEILDKPFVMIRKKGKLPGETVWADYSLEYGNNAIEIQKDAISPWSKVAIIDDLLATGGTLGAAASLVEKVWAEVSSLVCLIALDEPFLLDQPSRKVLRKYKTESVLHYD